MLKLWKQWQTVQGLSERTIQDRIRTIIALETFCHTTVDQITPNDIISFCARPELAQSSKASYHTSIRAFYKWALVANLLTYDPSSQTPSPKRPKGVPRPVPKAHIRSILEHATRRRTRAMIILATYAGLRVHEIAKFHGSDLDRDGGIITVTGKGGKTAMIPAHDQILITAKEFPDQNFWFPAYESQTNAPHIDSKAVSKAISQTMKRAGVNATPHQLRHYYATELLESGVDIRIVRDLMRHESIATTEIYTKVSMPQMRASIALLAA